MGATRAMAAVPNTSGQPLSLVTVQEWLPTWTEFTAKMFVTLKKPGNIGDPALQAIYNAHPMTDWMNHTWWIPLTVCTLYVLMIPFLKSIMAEREKLLLTPLVTAWNVFLSVFSMFGAYYTVPVLFNRILSHGFESTVCDPGTEYGHGYCGLFVFLFIVSKLFETVDTFFLLTRKSTVISSLVSSCNCHALLLACLCDPDRVCWHVVRRDELLCTFGHVFVLRWYMCGKTTRNLVKPFAMAITSCQILQMVVGIGVLVYSVMVQIQGRHCEINQSNQIMGLLMYVSYFLLFAKLFIEHYILGGKEKKEMSRTMSRTASSLNPKTEKQA